MSKRGNSSYIAVILALLACPAAFGQGTLLVDASGSMAGFAKGDPERFRGVLQRLHAGLSIAGPSSTQTAFLRDTPEGHRLDKRSLNEFIKAASLPANYKGDTPLQWGIEQGRMAAGEFVLVTDGMETGGRVAGVEEVLAEMAGSDWGIGIVATSLRFSGLYYTEMSVNLRELIPTIQKAVRAVRPAWEVAKGECPGNNCYYFNGERPLLFLLFAKSGDLTRLLHATVQALTENQLDASRKLQVSPFRPAKLTTELQARSSEAKVQMLLPDLAKGDHQFRCLVQGDKHLPVQISVHAVSEIDPPQPSSIHIIEKEFIEKPGWVAERKPLDNDPTNPVVSFDVVCLSQGLGSVFNREQFITLPGSLQVKFQQEWVPSSKGWWIDSNADDSWQYPHKVYKLAEVVREVHLAALRRHRESKSLSTSLSFTAAVRR